MEKPKKIGAGGIIYYFCNTSVYITFMPKSCKQLFLISKLIEKLLLSIFLIGISSFTNAQVTPDQIPGLQLWLSADSGVTKDISDKVSAWNDLSGLNYNAVQANAALQPTVVNNVVNNKPVIRFNGTCFLTLPNPALPVQNHTIFIVAKSSSSASNKALLGRVYSVEGYYFRIASSLEYHINNNVIYSAIPVNNNRFFLASARYDSFIQNLFIAPNYDYPLNNSQGPIIYSPNDAAAIGAALGSLGGYAWLFDGDIAEIIIYDNALSSINQNEIINYLRNKYAGPPANLGSDLTPNSFCNITLDAGNHFSKFLWSTSDTTQTISIDQTGNYWVSATDIFGYTSTDTILVTYPQISLSDTLMCANSSVILSTGLTGNFTYNWSNSDTTPTISISTPGYYSVTVTDSGLCTAVSDTITVSQDDFPTTASLGPDVNICSGNVIGLVFPTPLPNGLTYNWSTSDTISQVAIVADGNYSVTVTDSLGCVAADTINVTISGVAPAVSFNYSLGCSGDVSSFTNTSTPIGTNWLWDFGDGQTSTQQNPTHIFLNGGIYSIELTVSDGVCSNIITKIVHINNSPLALFNTDTACLGHAFNILDQSISNTGSIISWEWDFGDSSPHDTSQNPSHTYTLAGTYQITLTVTTDSACQSNISHSIIVVASAQAPGNFTLYQPLNNFVSSSALITFGWNPSAGARSYTFEYSTDSLFLSNVNSVQNILTTTHQFTLPTTQIYFWRIAAIGICGDQSMSEIRKISYCSPALYSNLNLWLSADSSITHDITNKVTAWNDRGAFGYNAIQANPAFQPLYIENVLNNKPVIRFDGSDYLTLPNQSLPIQNHSVFIVAKPSSSSSNKLIIGRVYSYEGFYFRIVNNLEYHINTGVLNSSIPLNNNNFFLASARYDSFLQSLFIAPNYTFSIPNTQGVINYSPNDAAAIGAAIGTAGGSAWFFEGDIAEIILYNTALNNNDRKSVESYLRYKYAPPVNLGPDISIPYGFCDTALYAGPRFTSYLWSTGDTTSSILLNSGGIYSVSVTDVFGFTSTDTVVVNKPVFHAHDSSGCLGAPVVITAGLGTYYNYSWSTGDTTESITLSLPGDYWLEITDTLGCNIRDTVRFVVDSFAVQATLGPDRSACRGEILGLQVGQQEAISYAWSTGSGDPQVMISNAPETSQDYAVTVTNAIGCEARDTVNIFVRGDVPMPGFRADSVCPGEGTSFTDLSSAVWPALPNAWAWDFGDGNTSNDQHPTHVYALSGLYNVTLNVTTDSGCSKPITKPVIVWAKPTVFFSPTNGCSGVSVPFHDYSTNTLGTNEQWWWDFGEPGAADTSVEQHPTWSYAQPGNYTVSLMVTSAAGCMDTLQHTIDVRETLPVGFMVSQSCLGQKVYFVDTTSTDPWSQIVERKWFFGDGDSSLFASPTHIYDTVGTYNVMLKVKSLNGCSVTKTIPVVVHPLPVAGIRNTNLCVSVPGQLMDSSSISGDVIDSWRWNIGESTTSTQQYPWFTPDSAGPVAVQLIVGSSNQCSDTATRTLTAYPLPHAEFSYTPEFGTAPLSVDFTNLSTGEANWAWDFGDGGNSISENPEYTFAAQGIFPVTLTVYSSYGCPHSVTHNMYVIMLINDIAVTDVQTVNSPTALSMKVRLLNNGTRTIEALTLKARFNGSNVISESWNGTLAPGQMLDYTFNAQFELTADQEVNYVCVEAETDGYADDRPENNSDCDVLNETFVVSNPYPNPVSGELILDVILPFADELTIAVYDEAGKRMAQIFDAKGAKGYTRYFFDASTLQAGAYAIHVRFRGKREVKKFVKQ